MHAHHNLIRAMIKEIRTLRRKLRSANDQIEELDMAAYRAEERASAARRESDRQAEETRRIQQEAEYRDYDRQEALRQLERARQWGNEWEIDKYTRRLRDLG